MVRAFLAELRQLDVPGELETDGRSLAQWLDWAEVRADAADPLRRGLADLFSEIGEVSAWTYRR